jgi:formyltetrahydrofolate deformylase
VSDGYGKSAATRLAIAELPHLVLVTLASNDDHRSQCRVRRVQQRSLPGLVAAVLARYMQILAPRFLDEIDCPVINIHHSFLPSFIGAAP